MNEGHRTHSFENRVRHWVWLIVIQILSLAQGTTPDCSAPGSSTSVALKDYVRTQWDQIVHACLVVFLESQVVSSILCMLASALSSLALQCGSESL